MNAELAKKVGGRLADLRQKRKIQMIDVALELSISPSQYSRIENGKQSLSVDAVKKICEFYKCSIDYVILGETNTADSVFFRKLDGCPETEKRRYLKILYHLMHGSRHADSPKYDTMHKLFGGGLLETIPDSATNAMPYVLEFERNRQKLSENLMIQELHLTRYKWENIKNGVKVTDMNIPLDIMKKYGYDLRFLMENELSENMFFDDIYRELGNREKENAMKAFDYILDLEGGEHAVVEVQHL